jgi:prolipoprotein diacylglyceryltransferase
VQTLYLFKILGVPFFSFTTFAVLGFVLSLGAALYEARNDAARQRQIVEAVMWLTLPALSAGRLVHVLYNVNYYAERQGELLRFTDGGMSFVGLFIGGVAGLWLWCRIRSQALDLMADRAALPVSILATCSWLGAYFHGGQFGAPVDNLVAQELRDTFGVIDLRWPTQLLAATWSGFIALILAVRVIYRPRLQTAATSIRPAGLFLGLYSIGLFMLDYTRADLSPIIVGLRLTQGLYVVLFVINLLIIGRSIRSA